MKGLMSLAKSTGELSLEFNELILLFATFLFP